MAGAASKYSRLALAGVRIFNGATNLAIPGRVAVRLGSDVDTSPGLSYMQRMFGIRTILVGAELVLSDRKLRSWALKVAPVIHAVDTTAAATAGMKGQLPRRAAAMLTLLSATNTVLALVAARGRTEK